MPDRISPRTPASLEAIEALAERLDAVVALRDSQPARIAEASRVRSRMYSLFLRSVKEVARAAEYLHADELDQYVPQLFPNRGRKRAVGDEPAAPEPPVEADEPAAEPPAHTTPPPALNGEVGTPHSSPFARVG